MDLIGWLFDAPNTNCILMREHQTDWVHTHPAYAYIKETRTKVALTAHTPILSPFSQL